MAQRFYSSIAQPTTLTASISSSVTTIAVAATVGYPSSFPFTVALDAGGATEELCDVTAVAGNVWTVTRGVDGTGAQSHSAGAIVRHSSSGRDFADMQNHINATTNVHGVTGALVGTGDTQTLSNKTLTSPTVNSGALSGTFAGTPAFSGAVQYTGDPVFEGATTTTEAAGVRVHNDTQHRLALRADGALVFGTGAATGDATLSRTGVNTLATSGGLGTGGDIAAVGAVGSTRTNATDAAFQGQLAGDTNSRFVVGGDGKIGWGTGVATRDTALYRTGPGALKTDGSLTTVGDLVAGGVGQRLFAIKSSDTSRANTASPAPDPHLTMSLAANSTYVISGVLVFGNSPAGDLNLGFDGPGAGDGWWSTAQPSIGVAATPTPVRLIATRWTAGRVYGYVDEGAGDPQGLQLYGILQTTAAITFRLLWSQATSNSTATIVYAQSYLLASRVA
jgi:hypothetical protein